MSAKYSALLEACNTIQLTGKLGILEESSVDEATSIKLQLVLQENVNFIKNQITRTPLIENVQMMLAEKWTQAILEDISFDDVGEFGNKVAGGIQSAAHGTAGTAGLLVGAAQGGNLDKLNYGKLAEGVPNIIKAGYNAGYNADSPSVGTTYDVAKFVGENPNISAGVLGAGALGVGAAATGLGVAAATGLGKVTRRSAGRANTQPKLLPR